MAKEISISSTFAVKKGSLSVTKNPAALSADMAGTHSIGGAIDIPTTAAGTAIPMGNVATAGVCYFCNTDATNYVEIGVQVSGTFYPLVKLKPGEAFPWRLAINAPYARAHTATCVVDYEIAED